MANQKTNQKLGHDSSHSGSGDHHGHFILPDSFAFKIFLGLIILTGVTVFLAQPYFVKLFGSWNIIIALLIATLKASMVALFFMGLKYDKGTNVVIFMTSLVFVAIFMVLTSADVFFRHDKTGPSKGFFATVATEGPGQFKKPWVASPEIIDHGKQLFTMQCASCHGVEGNGKGPAGAAFNPPPRNFTASEGWKNGRRPGQIVETLTKGLNSMPAFSSLPGEDRWALAHYVGTFNPSPLKDSDAELKAMGIDPTGDSLGASKEKSISIEKAIEAVREDK